MNLKHFALLALLTVPFAACGAPPAPTPDFTVSSTPANASLAVGATSTLNVTLDRQHGFDGAVAITLLNPPAGLITSSLTIPAGSSTGNLSLTASNALAFGKLDLKINAVSGDLVRTSSLALTVNATADFGLALTPSNLDIGVGHPGSFNATLTRFNGFVGAVSIAAKQGVPGLDANAITIAAGSSVGLIKVVATEPITTGDYTLTLVATGGSQSVSFAVPVSVVLPQMK
jgi:hypothetical protein